MSERSWLPIQTQRLILRDFRFSDFDDVQLYASDPEVSLLDAWGPNTEDDTRRYLERIVNDQAVSPRLDFEIAVQLNGAVVGSIGLRVRDQLRRTAELGFCLRRDCWRQGLTFEAAGAVLDSGFNALGLHRVFATCDTRNTGSFGVMTKLGMRCEGRFIQDKLVKDVWSDTYLYAILAREWPSK